MTAQKTYLYLYGFSIRQGKQIDNLFKILSEQLKTQIQIKFVLIHDGILGISKKARTPLKLDDLLNLDIKVYAVIKDIKARGLDPKEIDERIQAIDYEDLVDFLVETPRTISWM